MFLLPLPAAARVVLRRLGVKRFWARGLAVADMTKGLVLGIYSKDKEDDVPQLTSAGENFDKLVSGKLREILNISGPPLKAGKTRTFYGLHQDFPSVVVVGLGRRAAGVDDQENWHEGKENIRVAVAAGCRQVQDLEISSVEVDPCGDAQAAAEGAVLGLYEYDDLKQKKKVVVSAKLHGSGDQEAWQKGVLFASGQNLARQLMETPANEMTPTKFAKIIEKNLRGASSKTEVHIRPKSWIEEQEMGSFLSVAKGSDEPPVFLEIHYKGSPNASEAPLVFVGKGITFDRLQTGMQSAFGKPQGTVARVHIGQVIMSIRTKLQNTEHVIEALCRVKFKFPGRQKIHISKKWGFTKFNADEFEDMVAEKWLIPDGCGVKYNPNRGPLDKWRALHS